VKKFFFYVFAIAAMGITIDLVIKLFTDFDRLTRYGWGHITGRFLLLCLLTVVAVVLRPRKQHIYSGKS
jgi:hypothetical protein